MNIILFVGSGISFPSGLPNVDQITHSLLNNKWWEYCDKFYLPGVHPNEYIQSQDIVLRLQSFLKILINRADNYLSLKKARSVNYENLYYLSQQLADEEGNEIYNPIVYDFVADLNNNLGDLCKPIQVTGREISLKILANKSCELIQCVVWHELNKIKSLESLSLITELAISNYFNKIDIFTLNHDLLLESLFTTNRIAYIDGFKDAEGDVRYFDSNRFIDESKISLFKLHGSINWYRFRVTKDNYLIDKYGIPVSHDVLHSRDSEGKLISNLSFKPIFLTGTYNKMMDYGYGIYREMDVCFHTILKKTDLMIMSGYGWNDRGINGRLIDWIYSSPNRRLYLLHNNPVKIKESKSSLWWRYDELVGEGRLIPIDSWLCDTNLSELMTIINETTVDR